MLPVLVFPKLISYDYTSKHPPMVALSSSLIFSHNLLAQPTQLDKRPQPQVFGKSLRLLSRASFLLNSTELLFNQDYQVWTHPSQIIRIISCTFLLFKLWHLINWRQKDRLVRLLPKLASWRFPGTRETILTEFDFIGQVSQFPIKQLRYPLEFDFVSLFPENLKHVG